MATGFGIASDKAAVMSKALTQLGYDLATIFNVDYDIAMEKLESALAGQPRPMREWGFDMSEATLKLVAMKLGIEENVETMTQFEKAQLRFVQLMDTARKQGILGNFARRYTPPPRHQCHEDIKARKLSCKKGTGRFVNSLHYKSASVLASLCKGAGRRCETRCYPYGI